MHAVIRTYSGNGATELFNLLEKRTADIEELMRPIEGFVTYTLVRTPDGGASITVCRDRDGANESVRKAREWIAANASSIAASAPAVSEGPVILHLSARELAAAAPASAPLSTVS